MWFIVSLISKFPDSNSILWYKSQEILKDQTTWKAKFIRTNHKRYLRNSRSLKRGSNALLCMQDPWLSPWIFFFFFAVLGMELSASPMLGKHSTAELYSQFGLSLVMKQSQTSFSRLISNYFILLFSSHTFFPLSTYSHIHTRTHRYTVLRLAPQIRTIIKCGWHFIIIIIIILR
jgi:hypothetical protein